MADFDDRKKAYEDKFARDEELMFKARARAAKLLGVWIAGKTGEKPEDVSTVIVNHVTSGESDEELAALISADLANKGQKHSAHQVLEKFTQCLADAKAQMMAN